MKPNMAMTGGVTFRSVGGGRIREGPSTGSEGWL